MNYVISVLIGYVLGAVPFGYITVRLIAGKNVLEVGSGRTGATNALRAAGPVAAGITLISDLVKGVVAILLARILFGDPIAEALAGVAAILGHNASIFIWLISHRFEGGAGATTFVGAAIFIWLPIALLLLPATPIMLYVTGYSSVTSTILVLLALVVYLIRALQGVGSWADVLYALLGSMLVIYALRPNYRRLREGTERMVGPRVKRVAAKQAREVRGAMPPRDAH
jgi:acyl phosphate:glycerol-3-phosphate acyltransferase